MDYFDVVPLRRVPWGLGLFTYSHSEPVAVGSLVRCYFGGQLVSAVVWQKGTEVPKGVKVKPIESVAEQGWLTPAQQQLFNWVSRRYATPLPTLLYLFGLAPVQRVSKKLHAEVVEPQALPATWAEQSSLVVEASPADDAQAAAEVALAWSKRGQPVLVLCPTLNDG
jgi:primosomal protein N'